MSHECPDCGELCHCNGDIDDCCNDFEDDYWDFEVKQPPEMEGK